MCDLPVNVVSILVVKFLDLIHVRWGLGNQSAFEKEGFDVFELISGGELLDVLEELRLGDANQRVLNPRGLLGRAIRV